ncbi:MAG: GNAT family N-acetyltransferase, partial [Propionibacteriaceae bacterium]|nr:GNAT family N-acetyltransferase [Propionibacteriaceae bacterium]
MAERDHTAVVEGTLEWSIVTEADLPELSELRAAVEYFDNPIDHVNLSDLIADFRSYSQLPGWMATVGRVKGGGVAAYGGIHPDGTGRLWLQLAVHPAARHKQLGRRLVQWAVRRAVEWRDSQPEHTELWLGYLLEERHAGLRRVLVEEGFRAERWFFDAHRDLLEEPELSEVDPAITLVPYTPARSAEVRLLLNQVWDSVAGSRPVSEAEWQQQMR